MLVAAVLPAGPTPFLRDQRLATVFDPEPGTWFDPAYLQQLDASATRLTLTAGEKNVQDIRVSSR